MKIIHTADWHLGKRLCGKTRIDEQRALLAEITEAARTSQADITLIAGDVFDSFVPTAEAEELFYETLSALSEFTLPVTIAGNHDDPDRLAAPAPLARHKGVILLTDGAEFEAKGAFGGTATRVKAGGNLLEVERRGELLRLGYLCYPSSAKLLDLGGERDYSEAVAEMIKSACGGFERGANNMFVSHLFVTGAETERTDERELGGSKLLPKSAIEIENCGYVALGHIHKPMCVSRSANAFYSGSIASYDFSDTTEKRFMLVEAKDGVFTAVSVPLRSGKKLVDVHVSSADEAAAELAAHEDDYVRVIYESDVPLTMKEVAEMRRHACFCDVEAVRSGATAARGEVRRGKSDEELFEMFWKSRTSSSPAPEMKEIFMRALSGEQL